MKRVALAKREKEVMDILYRLERATVSEVRSALTDPPSYSAIRAVLRVLEHKGFVRHEHDAKRYVYRPTQDPKRVRSNALDHLLETFFEGSAEKAMTALVEDRGQDLSEDALRRLSRMIARAQKEGR